MRASSPSFSVQSVLADLVSEPRIAAVGAKVVERAERLLGNADIAVVLGDAFGSGADDPAPFAAERTRTYSAGVDGETLLSLERMGADLLRQPAAGCRLTDSAAIGLSGVSDPVAIAPLHFGEAAIGTLVGFGVDVASWDPDGLSALAAAGAIALENAYLFEAQEALARRDPLTGLLNHREFHEALSRELEQARADGGRFSLVLFDLDDFKVVNDSSGHAAGDRVLRVVAECLRRVCTGNAEAFRIGGDEFAIIVRGAGRDAASKLAERAAADVAAERRRAGVSWGVSLWPHDGPGRDALLRRADSELYSMKRSRRPSRGSIAPPILPASQREGGLQRERLEVARRLATMLAHARTDEEIARIAVEQLHHSFAYYLAVVQRLDQDGTLRVVGAEGPLAEGVADFLAMTQSVDEGVNGRVARTGELALVQDTRNDPDYLGQNARTDPRSELSLPIRVAGSVWGVLNLEQKTLRAFSDDDLLLADTVASQIGAAIQRVRLVGDLEGAFLTTLGVLADAVEMQDRYTADHAQEVAELSVRVGARMGIGGDELDRLRYGALLHDVGKIGVPGDLLRKAAPLSEDEREVMRRHTIIGAQMLERIPFLAPVAPLVRGAHERVDGTGYPDGIPGSKIPRGALIICACDAFDAMTSDRPYRAAMPHADAVGQLRAGSGSQFDTEVVEALLAELGEG